MVPVNKERSGEVMTEKNSSLTNKGKAFRGAGKALEVDLVSRMMEAGANFGKGLVGKGIGE